MEKITCIDCGAEFEISAEERKWYEDKGFDIPKRCAECRKRRKSEKRNKNRGKK